MALTVVRILPFMGDLTVGQEVRKIVVQDQLICPMKMVFWDVVWVIIVAWVPLCVVALQLPEDLNPGRVIGMAAAAIPQPWVARKTAALLHNVHFNNFAGSTAYVLSTLDAYRIIKPPYTTLGAFLFLIHLYFVKYMYLTS